MLIVYEHERDLRAIRDRLLDTDLLVKIDNKDKNNTPGNTLFTPDVVINFGKLVPISLVDEIVSLSIGYEVLSEAEMTNENNNNITVKVKSSKKEVPSYIESLIGYLSIKVMEVLKIET